MLLQNRLPSLEAETELAATAQVEENPGTQFEETEENIFSEYEDGGCGHFFPCLSTLFRTNDPLEHTDDLESFFEQFDSDFGVLASNPALSTQTASSVKDPGEEQEARQTRQLQGRPLVQITGESGHLSRAADGSLIQDSTTSSALGNNLNRLYVRYPGAYMQFSQQRPDFHYDRNNDQQGVVPRYHEETSPSGATRNPFLHPAQRPPILHSTIHSPFARSTTQSPFHHFSDSTPFVHSTQPSLIHSTGRNPFVHSSSQPLFLQSTTQAPFLYSSTQPPFIATTTHSPLGRSSTQQSPFVQTTPVHPFFRSSRRPSFVQPQILYDPVHDVFYDAPQTPFSSTIAPIVVTPSTAPEIGEEIHHDQFQTQFGGDRPDLSSEPPQSYGPFEVYNYPGNRRDGASTQFNYGDSNLISDARVADLDSLYNYYVSFARQTIKDDIFILLYCYLLTVFIQGLAFPV